MIRDLNYFMAAYAANLAGVWNHCGHAFYCEIFG